MLPDTTARRARRRWPALALAVAVLVALVAALTVIGSAALRAWSFSPGEEVSGSAVREIVVSQQRSAQPPPDIGSFEEPPGAVYVYLMTETGDVGELEVSVERVGSGSVLSQLFGKESELEVGGVSEEPTGSNVVRVRIGSGSGEPLPQGRYTVTVRAGGEGRGAEARKFFVVSG